MSMLHRNSFRSLLASSIVALALGGCSFSYSSGSAPPSNHAHSNHGKPVHKSSGGKKVDNREKALPSSSGEKPISKATDPAPERDLPKATDPTPAPEPEVVAPQRTKSAPKRTTGAPKRTPVADDTAEVSDTDTPASNTTIKAKTKPASPPSGSKTIVAPQ